MLFEERAALQEEKKKAKQLANDRHGLRRQVWVGGACTSQYTRSFSHVTHPTIVARIMSTRVLARIEHLSIYQLLFFTLHVSF